VTANTEPVSTPRTAELMTRHLEIMVGDLAMLVARLSRKLRKATPADDLPAQALDYLNRNGLRGSPLREVGADGTATVTREMITAAQNDHNVLDHSEDILDMVKDPPLAGGDATRTAEDSLSAAGGSPALYLDYIDLVADNSRHKHFATEAMLLLAEVERNIKALNLEALRVPVSKLCTEWFGQVRPAAQDTKAAPEVINYIDSLQSALQAERERALQAEAINKRLVELVKAAKFYADHGLSTPVYNKDGTCYFADEPLKKALAAFEEYGEAELP
jgi:hypothetical protein